MKKAKELFNFLREKDLTITETLKALDDCKSLIIFGMPIDNTSLNNKLSSIILAE